MTLYQQYKILIMLLTAFCLVLEMKRFRCYEVKIEKCKGRQLLGVKPRTPLA